MNTIQVIITDFGTVRCGPIFSDYMRLLLDDLKVSKRTKKYKTARKNMDTVEECCFTLSKLYWESGKTLKVTP
jgi:hypothetical protein